MQQPVGAEGLGLAGMMSVRTHGPVNIRDAQRVEWSFG